MAQRITDSTDTSLATADLVADLGELFARISPLTGSWTPTITNGANVAASTPNANCFYIRLGAFVLAYGTLEIDPTSASTLTGLELSLPVSSNFSSFRQLVGGAQRASGASLPVLNATVTANTTTDAAAFGFTNDTDVASRSWVFWFFYQVV